VPTQAQVVAAIVAALSAAVTVAGVVAALGSLMLAAGVGYLALRAVAALMLSWPPAVLEGTGPASRWAVRTNALRRAAFFLHACRRVQAAISAARARNEPVMEAVREALAAERRFMSQQIAASLKRTEAASAVDGAAAMHGPLLGWNAVLDSRTTAECRAADGKSFSADRPPLIGYPGTVHSRCRCWPGPPRKGALILP
jgi:hypothetical protein